jgi:dynein heavy chain
LEPVFTGGDIAKQMPLQAKQFAGIDKTWMKCMEKSFETKRVLQCCELDLLKDNLPDMQKKLEECQKLLEDYLERKRKLFPRFYFVSNPALLKILSQGSDPSTIQEDFEKLFDAITKVEFGKSDKKGSNEKTITTIMQEDGGVEKVKLTTPVKCEGNIESWLNHLEKEMQDTMREHCRIASVQVMSLPLEQFVHGSLSQVALMGIQLIWTQKIT